MPTVRRARIRSLAKINLDLRILNRRPDGFHELRTVFQTISLADTIDIAFTPGRRTRLSIHGNVEIPGNLILRAAEAVLGALRIHGEVEFGLNKKIPMGGGLGGGSGNAASVLLALPVLAGGALPLEKLMRLGAELGSDVPFFLLGGTAVGFGRGTELYPLPDHAPAYGLVVAPDVHVSTAEAYAGLGRELTFPTASRSINSFQACVWQGASRALEQVETARCTNDFETVVFRKYPQLKSIKEKLLRLGADPALMSGSGCALAGMFRTRLEIERAKQVLGDERVYPISLVSRRRYRRLWWRQLREHIEETVWPPRSRYER
jgi:4-diphosphocytidyl-2-C-methyl-D-erythritol kinase